MASTIYNKNNMSTSDVKKMQQALKDAGYDIGSSGVDGIWGPATSAALSQFKADTGGSNTYGTTVGNETFNKLYGTGSSNKGGTASGSSNKGGSTGGTTTVPTGTTAGSSGINWGTTATPNATVNAGGMNIPGTNYYVPATMEGVEAHKQGTAAYENYLSNVSGVENAYGGYITQLQGGANNANAALDSARANALAGIQSVYDDSARNYYRLYKTQEKELPEQLSSIGATGGATESAALRLMNAYSDNLHKNETARNKDITGINDSYYNAIAQNSQKLAAELADAYLQLGMAKTNLQNDFNLGQQNIYSQYQQGMADQYAAQEQANAAAAIQRWNTSVTDRMAQQLAKGDTIWTWTDSDGKKHWSTYESVGLANGGKELSGSTDKKKVGSGGGSSGSGGSGSGTGGNTGKTSDYSTVKAQAQMHMLNSNIFSGMYNSPVNAVNYIESSGLSNTQKDKLYKELGFA